MVIIKITRDAATTTSRDHIFVIFFFIRKSFVSDQWLSLWKYRWRNKQSRKNTWFCTLWSQRKLRMLEADSRADGVFKIQYFIDQQNQAGDKNKEITFSIEISSWYRTRYSKLILKETVALLAELCDWKLG